MAGVASALAIFMIVFTGSRGAWFGLVAAAAIWLGVEAVRWKGPRRRVALIAFVAVVVALVVAVLAIPQLEKRISSPSSEATIQWRLVAWRAAGRTALSRPLLGWGPNSFRIVYTSYWPRTVQAKAADAATVGDPHDIVMSAAASLGIPGALALLALIGTAGLACVGLTRARRDDDLRPVAICTALVGGLAALMFHYATLDTMPILAVLLGILVAAQTKPIGSITPAASGWARAATIALASVLSIMMIAAAGLAGADTVMRDAFVQAAGDAPWAAVGAQLHAAEALAPWEPTFGWAIGKAAIEALQNGSNLQAYSDGQKALEATRRVLPSDPAVVYDSAYLTLRYGIVNHDETPIRNALNAFVRLGEEDPNNPTYWSARGLAVALLGEYVEAERDLRTALLLSPRNAEYTKALQQVESAARSGQ